VIPYAAYSIVDASAPRPVGEPGKGAVVEMEVASTVVYLSPFIQLDLTALLYFCTLELVHVSHYPITLCNSLGDRYTVTYVGCQVKSWMGIGPSTIDRTRIRNSRGILDPFPVPGTRCFNFQRVLFPWSIPPPGSVGSGILLSFRGGGLCGDFCTGRGRSISGCI
jgi:hypothetical protein